MTDRNLIFRADMVRALLEGRKTQTRRFVNLDRYSTHLVGYDSTGLLKQYEPGKLGVEFVNAARGLYSRENPDGLSAKYVPISFFVGDRIWVREKICAEQLSFPPVTRKATTKERQLLKRTEVADFNELDGLNGVQYLADGAWIKIENSISAGDLWSKLFNYKGTPEGNLGSIVPTIHMPRWASRLTLIVTDVRVQRLQDISEEDARAEGIFTPEIGYVNLGKKAPVIQYAMLWNELHGPDAWDANPWVSAITFTVHHGNIDQMRAA
jgi:hypothetical protein